MASYNGEKYICAQLESILRQLSENDEVVISDDSSTDKTIDIIKDFNDKRIRLFEYNQFYNPMLNFENALKKASGDLIFLSDQDDIWLDNKVKVVTNLLDSYDLVVSDCILINENEAPIHDSFFKQRGSGPGIIHNLIKNSYIGCCMAFHRNILQKALPFPGNTPIPMHDWWIGMVGELFGKTCFCEEKLVLYRRHYTNASRTSEKSFNSFSKKMRIRTILACEISKRYLELRERNKL
jgi:glycosyltransferase involved in cell wall biosynthesis